MKRYLDLVPISAKVHRKQNRMSIFCIALAVFLVTTIFGMADMFIRSQIIKTQAETGNWHIGIQNITSEDAAVIAARPDVAALAPYNVLNYDGKQGYILAETEVVLCGSNDRLFSKIFSNMLSEGTFPKTDHEAMVTESARDMLDLHIGDEITINTPAGLKLIFTLSGFVANTANLMNSDTYGVFLTTEKLYDIFSMNGSDGRTDYPTVYYVQFASTLNVQSEIENLKSQCGLSGDQVSENTKLLGLLGQSTSSFMIQVYAAAAVLFVLVLFAGIMMIASSLNSNVAQRTEFYGLMRCVGATPKQVMRMVRKEALTWCKSAIPAGVVIGVVVIWILCFVLRLLSPEYFGAMPLFSTSYPSIIAGVVVGLLTVLMAARTPAKRAAKVSPLSAVSGNANDTQPVRKAANTNLFKVDAALGIHHAKSSRKNFILMVGSFGLSIVLFLAFSVTIEFMNHTLRPLHPWTPDISVVSPDNTCSINRAYLDELKNNAVVKSAYGRMFAYNVPITVNGQEQQTDLISYEQQQFEWAKSYMLGGSLDAVQNELNTGLIVYEPQNTIQIGDTVSLSFNGQTAEIEIVGMLSDSPFFNSADVRTIICSEDTFRQLTGQSDYTVIDMQLTNRATDAEVNTIHRTYGAGYSFVDKRMDNSSTLSIYYCVWLFLYGFLALIALITVFNIINSIAMSVTARTKQYGAFRAIGLSDRQLSKMIIAEAASYAIAGSIAGSVLGVICNKFLFDLLISRQWGEGVDKKLWYNALFFLLIVILYYISTGGIHMDDIKSPSAVTIGELSRIVKEFEEKIQNGTEDPDRFLTLTEIEELWGKLIGDTNVLYSDMLQSLIQNIDERELVRQKKREFQARGIKLRTNRRAERSILTLHGKLAYSRNILIPADQESKEILAGLLQTKKVVPLDDALGISNLPFKMTPALMLRCAYWAQNQCSYQAAEDVMRNTYRLDINDDTIRLVTNYIGKAVFEEDCRQAEAAFEKFDSGKAVFKNGRKGILYIEADGAALNTRHKNDEGSTWRENKLGVVYSSDHIYYWKNKKEEREHRITKRDYVSYVGASEQFKKHLYQCALRNGYGDYEETVLLSDGAAWIANMAEEMFPDARHILDLFHLKENVYDFARNKFRFDESRYTPWAERICGLLEDGKGGDVLKELDPDENYSNCVNLYHYITMHRGHINYPEYKSKGYFCGSGAVESGNKVVLQKRLKQSGMRWEAETAQYLLTLKSKYESGRWEKDVVAFFSDHIRTIR